MAIDGTKSEDPKNSVVSSNTTDTSCGEVTMAIIKDGNGKEVGTDKSTVRNEGIDKEMEIDNGGDIGSVKATSPDKTEQENGDDSDNGTFKFKPFTKFPADIQRHIIHQYIDSLEPQVVEVEITTNEIEFEEEDDYLYGNEFMDTKMLALTNVPESLRVSSDVRRLGFGEVLDEFQRMAGHVNRRRGT